MWVLKIRKFQKREEIADLAKNLMDEFPNTHFDSTEKIIFSSKECIEIQTEIR